MSENNQPAEKIESKASSLDISQYFNSSSMKSLLEKLLLTSETKQGKPIEEHKFWKDQPVMKGETPKNVEDTGPIEQKTVADIKTVPYDLPKGVEWSDIDISVPEQLDELYKLLTDNYVEDDGAAFRFDYSREFLSWALNPPEFMPELLIGIRSTKSKELIGFISGIPSTLHSYHKTVPSVEINFLCVNKRLRNQRLAPILIQEVTRRVNLHNIWQAAYTSGTYLPTPVGSCRYHHRSLNPKKLLDVQFSYKSPDVSLSAYQKKYKLPGNFTVSGFRLLKEEDAAAALALYTKYQENQNLYPMFTLDEFKHWFLPRNNVIATYVREVDGKITDFFSYYYLPSTITNHKVHKTMNAVFSFYNVATSIKFEDLILQALIQSKNDSQDVYNALELMDNHLAFKPLEFAAGTGLLHYYMYNWQCPTVDSNKIGLVLL